MKEQDEAEGEEEEKEEEEEQQEEEEEEEQQEEVFLHSTSTFLNNDSRTASHTGNHVQGFNIQSNKNGQNASKQPGSELATISAVLATVSGSGDVSASTGHRVPDRKCGVTRLNVQNQIAMHFKNTFL